MMNANKLITTDIVTLAPKASPKHVTKARVEHRILGIPVCREVGKENPDETLCVRVDELIRCHKHRPLLWTTGSRGLIEELATRSEGLEEAVREIALEVQKIAASQNRTSGTPVPDEEGRIVG
jgi:CBS domain-containing protein